MTNEGQRFSKIPLPLLLFLFARIPLLLALPFSGLLGYGDLTHFFNQSEIPGLPYIHYWSEYPPVFPFIIEGLYALSGGVEHVFTYLLVALLLAADIGSLLLFGKLDALIHPAESAPSWRWLVYAALLAGLPYGWWYFDPLAVFFLLLALYLGLAKRSALSLGLALGMGIATKIFPVLILPALVKYYPLRRAALATVIGTGVFALPLLALWVASPEFTRASLSAVSVRRSHETVWALIDSNLAVGGFGPLVERTDPALVETSPRNPPVIPPALTLAVFGALGFFAWLRARLDTPLRAAGFAGLTMVIFYLWSSAWSPQWILYLLPVALLTLPRSPGLLLVAALVLVNLLEWPVLLSRGLFATLPLTILLRLFLMLLLGWLFYRESVSAEPVERSSISQA